MNSLIIREILAPMATRIGTFLGAVIVGYVAADSGLGDELGAVLASGILISIDLVNASIVRRLRDRKNGVR